MEKVGVSAASLYRGKFRGCFGVCEITKEGFYLCGVGLLQLPAPISNMKSPYQVSFRLDSSALNGKKEVAGTYPAQLYFTSSRPGEKPRRFWSVKRGFVPCATESRSERRPTDSYQ